MKILAWNIRHGGGSRIPAIASAIVAHAPDVAVLTDLPRFGVSVAAFYVWRRKNPDGREYSWYSRRGGRDLNGFRLDHILASPAIASRLRSSQYSHAEREAFTSDHSILLAEFGRRPRIRSPLP